MQKPKTLLFIEDKRPVLDAFRSYFGGRDYHVLTASTAKEGLGLLATTKVDFVVLDYQMPGMSSAAVLQVIKRLQPGTSVLTLYGAAHAIPQDVRNAATAVMMNGMLLSELMRSVERVFDAKAGRN